MSLRNLSPQQMFHQLALEHRPHLRFAGENQSEFTAWKQNAWPQVLATLGDFPERVEPEPQLLAEWQHDGLHKQRWIIEVGAHISATFQINYPDGFRESEKRAAILCWHGHGPYGKEVVMGDDSSPEIREQVARANYDYGHQMAKAGFITFAIDWIGRGDRDDSKSPQHSDHGQDWCDLYYLQATMLGMTSLSINVAHGRAATDFACTLPGVDTNHLGVMGLSGGGTMALWSALCDERLKAVEIICYSDLWQDFLFRDVKGCGMQVAPGLYKLVNLPDLQGLLAPRPLLIDIGVHDNCFLVDTAMQCYRQVERIYQAAGAAERLELDLFPGGHVWGANKAVAFFQKHLAAGADSEPSAGAQ